MTVDGQNIPYASWMADNTMREALGTPGVMPKYFKALQEGIEEPPEGEPVIGYRVVHRLPSNVLAQPFVDRLGSVGKYLKIDALLTGESNLFADLTKLSTTELGQINVDPKGEGYYYFPDRDMAEDYMKAIVYKSAERFHYIKAGSYELYRVKGYAKRNLKGDEGFVMDEMQYDPSPLVSVPLNEPWEHFHP